MDPHKKIYRQLMSIPNDIPYYMPLGNFRLKQWDATTHTQGWQTLRLLIMIMVEIT